jgi:hypothetical protein
MTPAKPTKGEASNWAMNAFGKDTGPTVQEFYQAKLLEHGYDLEKVKKAVKEKERKRARN